VKTPRKTQVEIYPAAQMLQHKQETFGSGESAGWTGAELGDARPDVQTQAPPCRGGGVRGGEGLAAVPGAASVRERRGAPGKEKGGRRPPLPAGGSIGHSDRLAAHRETEAGRRQQQGATPDQDSRPAMGSGTRDAVPAPEEL
jgi:hypothetical protein